MSCCEQQLLVKSWCNGFICTRSCSPSALWGAGACPALSVEAEFLPCSSHVPFSPVHPIHSPFPPALSPPGFEMDSPVVLKSCSVLPWMLILATLGRKTSQFFHAAWIVSAPADVPEEAVLYSLWVLLWQIPYCSPLAQLPRMLPWAEFIAFLTNS